MKELESNILEEKQKRLEAERETQAQIERAIKAENAAKEADERAAENDKRAQAEAAQRGAELRVQSENEQAMQLLNKELTESKSAAAEEYERAERLSTKVQELEKEVEMLRGTMTDVADRNKKRADDLDKKLQESKQMLSESEKKRETEFEKASKGSSSQQIKCGLCRNHWMKRGETPRKGKKKYKCLKSHTVMKKKRRKEKLKTLPRNCKEQKSVSQKPERQQHRSYHKQKKKLNY